MANIHWGGFAFIKKLIKGSGKKAYNGAVRFYDDDFILILITCKYTHFWDFTVYTNNFVMLEDVTNT